MSPLKDYPGPRRSFPWINLTIVVVNVLVFVFELAVGSVSDLDALLTSAGVIPIEYTRGVSVGLPPPLGILWLTLITSMFLHGGFLHIASNMLYLFIFGDNVEDRLGHLRFFVFYFVCGLAAGITHIVVNAGSSTPSVGASGAIAGVLAAYLRLFPHAQVRTLLFIGPFILVPRIAGAFLILFWFVTQFFTNPSEGVAWVAHVGGFLFGALVALFLRNRLRPPAEALPAS